MTAEGDMTHDIQAVCDHCDEPITRKAGVWVHNRGGNHWAVSCPPRTTRATPAQPPVSIFAGLVKRTDYAPTKAERLYLAVELSSVNHNGLWPREMRDLVAEALQEAGTVKAVCVNCKEAIRFTGDDVLFPCKCVAGWMWTSRNAEVALETR